MTVGIDTDFLVRLSIANHPGKVAAEQLRDHHLEQGDRFALAPQVVAEFVHVVTDPRRFERPMNMESALQLGKLWWQAAEVFPIFPAASAMEQFFTFMESENLGRERILDTMLAATCLGAGVTRLITGNPNDYRLFPSLELIEM